MQIITGETISQMTGYTKPAYQQKWFNEKGYSYQVNAKGELWTTDDWLNGKDKYKAMNEDDAPMYPFKWLELNGKHYIHNLDDIQIIHPSQVPNDCGIYFLFMDRVLTYIGKSVRMEERIYTHLDNGKIFNGVKCVQGIPSEHLEHFEYFYIAECNPPENKLRKGAPDPLVKYLGCCSEVAA